MHFSAKTSIRPYGLPASLTSGVAAGLFCVERKQYNASLPATTSPWAGSMEDRRGRT